jgi:hypothetical protein
MIVEQILSEERLWTNTTTRILARNQQGASEEQQGASSTSFSPPPQVNHMGLQRQHALHIVGQALELLLDDGEEVEEGRNEEQFHYCKKDQE